MRGPVFRTRLSTKSVNCHYFSDPTVSRVSIQSLVDRCRPFRFLRGTDAPYGQRTRPAFPVERRRRSL